MIVWAVVDDRDEFKERKLKLGVGYEVGMYWIDPIKVLTEVPDENPY